MHSILVLCIQCTYFMLVLLCLLCSCTFSRKMYAIYYIFALAIVCWKKWRERDSGSAWQFGHPFLVTIVEKKTKQMVYSSHRRFHPFVHKTSESGRTKISIIEGNWISLIRWHWLRRNISRVQLLYNVHCWLKWSWMYELMCLACSYPIFIAIIAPFKYVYMYSYMFCIDIIRCIHENHHLQSYNAQ